MSDEDAEVPDEAGVRGGMTLIGVGTGIWLVAIGYFLLRPNLWILDLVLVPAAWIGFLVGIACLWVGVVRARSVFVTVAVIALSLVLLVLSATVGTRWLVSPRVWFDTHRSLYDAALSVDPGSAYYGAALPVHLRFLATGGKVSAGPGGSRFFPQWIGIPDDAGGYWHVPSGSPDGFDMYGMMCRNPVSLGGDWWMCGMRD